MMAMKSVNESYSRRPALSELKTLLHKLMKGEIRVVDLSMLTEMTQPLSKTVTA